MTKKTPLYVVVIVAVIAAVVTFNASFLFFEQKYNSKLNETLAGYSYFDKLLSVDEIVRANYIGDIDDDALKASVVRGYLSGIGDKYSLYMTSTEYDEFMKEQSGNAVGIGVNVIYGDASGIIEIINVLPDSPAEEAGMREGDIIVSVAGKKVADIGYYAALDMIRGEEGTKAELTVVRDGKEIPFTCERRAVKTLSVTYHVFGGSGNVGVIRLTEFNSTTPEQFKNAVSKLKDDGCDRFVFDLRNNGGGELNSILEVLDYLLPEGPIAHIYYRTGKESHYTSDAACLEARVAVLTNGRTASAAELFTSALRDYTRHGDYDAVLVGTKTYGKGVLQSFYKLKDGSAFKISTGKYNPPYSENYDGIGITPDIVIELSKEAASVGFYKLTDENDNQLIAAVNAIK